MKEKDLSVSGILFDYYIHKACKQHVVKYLNATDLLPFLMTDCSVVMARFNEHGTNARVVHREASCLHERDNATFPESLVHADSILRVVVLLKEGDALSNQLLNVFFFHNNKF